MEYESAEPKVNGPSVYLMSEFPEVVRQLLQVNHRLGGYVVGPDTPTLFQGESNGTVPGSTTVKHNRTSAHSGTLQKIGDSHGRGIHH